MYGDCTCFGAQFPRKKTLKFTQNPENKGSIFFSPSRSMVLKVVTGKIFNTLELDARRLPVARFRELHWKLEKRTRSKLSKSVDYLVDNLYIVMLSKIGEGDQEEGGRVGIACSQIGNSAPVPAKEKPSENVRSLSFLLRCRLAQCATLLVAPCRFASNSFIISLADSL